MFHVFLMNLKTFQFQKRFLVVLSVFSQFVPLLLSGSEHHVRIRVMYRGHGPELSEKWLFDTITFLNPVSACVGVGV